MRSRSPQCAAVPSARVRARLPATLVLLLAAVALVVVYSEAGDRADEFAEPLSNLKAAQRLSRTTENDFSGRRYALRQLSSAML